VSNWLILFGSAELHFNSAIALHYGLQECQEIKMVWHIDFDRRMFRSHYASPVPSCRTPGARSPADSICEIARASSHSPQAGQQLVQIGFSSHPWFIILALRRFSSRCVRHSFSESPNQGAQALLKKGSTFELHRCSYCAVKGQRRNYGQQVFVEAIEDGPSTPHADGAVRFNPHKLKPACSVATEEGDRLAYLCFCHLVQSPRVHAFWHIEAHPVRPKPKAPDRQPHSEDANPNISVSACNLLAVALIYSKECPGRLPVQPSRSVPRWGVGSIRVDVSCVNGVGWGALGAVVPVQWDFSHRNVMCCAFIVAA